MKKMIFLTILALGLYSCSNEDVATDAANANALKGNPNSGSNLGDYNINVQVNSDGSLWTYTLTKKSNKSKDLSHFIIDLGNCGEESASFANIIYATANGAPADLSTSEGAGTGCNPQATTTNFVKINFNEDASTWVVVIKFDRGYFEYTTAAFWLKAGTSCNQGVTTAPGCPREEYCSFSQGFFFANGTFNNGASASWVDGLTIGGVTYTQAQGNQIWNIDRGPGGNQVLNGFFQLGAVRLSGVEAGVQSQVDIIEAYFTAVGNVFNYLVTVNGKTYFNLPASAGGYTAQQVAAAGGAIGSFVDANHCP